jgi:hypothetical protein
MKVNPTDIRDNPTDIRDNPTDIWFNPKDIQIKKPILIENLHGYVLPHAGTEFTGNIISHTLRFRPMKKIKKFLILYYPASAEPDANGVANTEKKYYHEYYVPWQSLLAVFGPDYIYEGYNINDKIKSLDLKDTILVVSADFSHFLPFQEAIELENKAAQSLMFKEILSEYQTTVDDLKTFKVLFDLIPWTWQLQWVGRERSSGLKAVGYLSFLLRETPPTTKSKPIIDGIFVTAYDRAMKARECQGKWFSPTQKWSLFAETTLLKEVLRLGETTSRLTNGRDIEKPLTHYSITYLYKDTVNPFIRGWHGILHNAFYLPDVFLENTFNNGRWITEKDTVWPKGDIFAMGETLQHLTKKAAGIGGGKKKSKKWREKIKKTLKKKGGKLPYTLYSTRVVHYRLRKL